MNIARAERGEVVRRWAEKKYNLTGVSAVGFEDADDPDWSEYTPGIGRHIQVTIYKNDEFVECYTEEQMADLIVEICQFADKHRELST